LTVVFVADGFFAAAFLIVDFPPVGVAFCTVHSYVNSDNAVNIGNFRSVVKVWLESQGS